MLVSEPSEHTFVSFTWSETSYRESEDDNTEEVEALRGRNQVFIIIEIESGKKWYKAAP